MRYFSRISFFLGGSAEDFQRYVSCSCVWVFIFLKGFSLRFFYKVLEMVDGEGAAGA